jgi:hypothetical protein
MARRLSWSDVRGGVIASLAIIVVALAILKFSRVGALHGDTFALHAVTSDARGLMKGSEVWLSGQKIGKVTGISFRSPQVADTLHRVAIEMEILSRYRNALRHDAVGRIRAGGSFIGPTVVYLWPGTANGSPIEAGDTLRLRESPELERASAQLSVAAREIPAIMANVKVLGTELQATGGTLGAMLNGPGFGELRRARIGVSRLGSQLTNDHGTTGQIMHGDLAARAQRVMARVDSVRGLLSSPQTSLGRFRRDSTLVLQVGDIRNELTLVQAQLHSPDGTVGRFAADSAITHQLAGAQREMALLFADIKQHPLRYLSF